MLTWVKQRVEDIVKSDESWSLKLPDASAKISSVKEIKGEASAAHCAAWKLSLSQNFVLIYLCDCSLQASVSKRKGTKLFAMYDLAVTLKWSGSDDGKEVRLAAAHGRFPDPSTRRPSLRWSVRPLPSHKQPARASLPPLGPFICTASATCSQSPKPHAVTRDFMCCRRCAGLIRLAGGRGGQGDRVRL